MRVYGCEKCLSEWLHDGGEKQCDKCSASLVWYDNDSPHSKIRGLLTSMQGLINESYGVAGYHLNGEVATWDYLELESEVADALSALDSVEFVDKQKLETLEALEQSVNRGLVGETDGVIDTRRVLIPIAEYDAHLSVIDAARALRETFSACSVWSQQQADLHQALKALEAIDSGKTHGTQETSMGRPSL